MGKGAPRIAAGLLLLAGLWVAVYWWWPEEPRVTLATERTRPVETTPAVVPDEPAPQPEPALAAPEVPAPAPEKPTVFGRAVVPPEFTEHTVVEGDTLSGLSRRYFGSEAHAAAIARANPLMSPTPLKVGRVIRIPKDPENIQGRPVPPAPSEYVVKKGDSLSKIAVTVYGESRLSTLIFEANRDTLKDEHSLKEGQTLRLPPKPTPTPTPAP